MREIFIRGRVGSGKKYDSEKRKWDEQTTSILGYEPFQGTLNVGMSPKLNFKEVSRFKSVKPFKDFVAIQSIIENEIQAHCCYSIHRKAKQVISTFYIISNVKIRDKLNLSDGDLITIKLLV